MDEIQPQIMADKYAWPLAKKFPMTSIDEVISFSKSLDPTKAEGFVICDAQFNRVKVKFFLIFSSFMFLFSSIVLMLTAVG